MIHSPFKAVSFFVTAFVLFSFLITENQIIGTYGVSDIQLTIYSNNTFLFKDFTNSVKKFEKKGTWKMKGKKMILKSNSEKDKFHNIWTFHQNGQVAKSHKGLTFYRLCKIAE